MVSREYRYPKNNQTLSMKVALITGITGQDGSYLAELLLEKGYEVHGIKRRSSSFNTDRIDHLYQDPHHPNQKLKLHYGDLSDPMNITKIIKECQPDEIYNLGAMSHVKVSFDTPEYVGDIDGLGALRILEAVRLLGLENKTRIYQASTSELYGGMSENKNEKGLYDEDSPFYPRSPYGVAKLYGYWITKNYREAYNMFSCNGILFNHESPRRGFEFVTRKITHSVARIKFGLQKDLKLGNMDAKRDWGHAKDYVEAMWLMLNQRKPEDYVISTGKHYSVRDFTKLAFDLVDLDYKKYVKIDKKLYRPSEVESLLGDCKKAKKILKWKPKYDFKKLVKDMMQADLEFVEKEGY